MKKYLFALIMLLMSVGVSQSGVIKIVGLQGACDTTLSGCNPIPLNASLLCDGTGAILDCPQYAGPDYADNTGLRFFGLSNRANPPRCVKSVNGGTTWGLCDSGTVSPFTGALDLSGGNFATAADGSLIAAADQGSNNCIIRRSTDYGVSWTTVFTDSVTVNLSCGLGFGFPTPNTLKCASSSPYCVMIGFISGSFNLLAFWSNDYGQSWSTGTVFNITSSDSQVSVAVGSGGTSGSLTRYNANYNTAGRKFANTSGGDWSLTNLIPTSAGSADGQVLRCMSALMGTGQNVFCGPDQTATTTYRYFSHSGVAVSLAASVIPPNGLTNAQTPDFITVGYNSSTGYVIARNNLNSVLNVWVTQDSFVSLIQIATLTPTTALVAGAPRGDMFTRNGKVYFTSGAAGANALFGVIQ